MTIASKKTVIVVVTAALLGMFGLTLCFLSPFVGGYLLILTLPVDAKIQSPRPFSSDIGRESNIYEFRLSGATDIRIVESGGCHVWHCKANEPASEEYTSLDSATIHSLPKCED